MVPRARGPASGIAVSVQVSVVVVFLLIFSSPFCVYFQRYWVLLVYAFKSLDGVFLRPLAGTIEREKLGYNLSQKNIRVVPRVVQTEFDSQTSVTVVASLILLSETVFMNRLVRGGNPGVVSSDVRGIDHQR